LEENGEELKRGRDGEVWKLLIKYRIGPHCLSTVAPVSAASEL